MFRVAISVYPERHIKRTNTLNMENVDFRHDEAGNIVSTADITVTMALF
jgi:hypothetical protein